MTRVETELLQRFAEEVAVLGGLKDKALRAAFAKVRRSDFLPHGPWVLESLDGAYYLSDNDDQRQVMHSVGVALDPNRGLNNGNPARVGRVIEATEIKPGDRVLHVGAGAGYYSAVIAELVGPEGAVIAAEIDQLLFAEAQRNLMPWNNVQVVGDALALDLPSLDVVFSSAGIADLPLLWLLALKPGGRMLLPLTGSGQGGFIFYLRRLAGPTLFEAKVLSAQRYYPCLGTRDPAAMAAVDLAMQNGKGQTVRSLRLAPHTAGGDCWLHGHGWCLSYLPCPE